MATRDTLRQLIDKLSACRNQRRRLRISAACVVWWRVSCDETNYKAPRENIPPESYVTDHQAWRQQFDVQRRLFQSKFVDFLRKIIDNDRNNPRALWRTVNSLLKALVQQSTNQLNARKFAELFQSKVKTIRDSTALLLLPSFCQSSVTPLASFEPVTDTEVSKILSCCPIPNHHLWILPTWLFKVQTAVTPVCSCYTSLVWSFLGDWFFSNHPQACYCLYSSQKTYLDPDSLSSYRSISNLSFVSKLVERAVAKRFTSPP